MFEVRKSVARVALIGLTAGLLGATFNPAAAQTTTRRRRETNASREARIQRTIQETYSHRWEVFGGGGYMRFRSGETTKRNNEVSWATSTTYYLSPRLGVVGQAQGSFGNAYAQRPLLYPQAANPQINEYFFLGGANYRFYEKEKGSLSVEALGGAGWGIFSGGSKGIPPTQLGLWPDSTRPAFSASLHGEYNFYPNLAFRVAPGYMVTTFGGSTQANFQVNAGIVYRFGKQ